MLYTYTQLKELAKPYLENKTEIIACEDGNFFDVSKELHAINHCKALEIKNYVISKDALKIPELKEQISREASKNISVNNDAFSDTKTTSQKSIRRTIKKIE